MKTKIIGILVCTLLIATALPAVGTINKDDMNTTPQRLVDVEWEYTYGGDEFDWLYDIQPTTDGGYVATGISVEDDMNYAWVLKVDADGEEEWSTLNYDFNGSEIDIEIIVSCVRETPDEGYLIGGFGWFYSTLHDAWLGGGRLWKVNSTGDTMWFQFIGSEEEMWTLFPFNIIVVDDGFICGGIFIQFTETDYYQDIGLFKTDFSGTLQWHKAYDAGGQEFARSLWITEPDDGYFLAGTTSDNDETDQEAYYMVKTDSEGTLEWDAIFDGPIWDYSPTMGCRQTSDGGYIMGGISASYGAGGSDLWIVKTDEDGDMEWNTTYGGPNYDRCYGMDATDDGGYVFVVIKNAYAGSGTRDDMWIINTDSEGNLEWEFLYEEEGIQWTQSIVQTDDGGFIVAGRTGAMNAPISDGLICKVGPFPQLDIEIAGGLGIEASVTNNGLGDAVQAPYEMTVTGGILDMINKTVNGTIDIEAGATETITSGLLFGLGGIEISVKVGVKEETAQGTQFLIFSIVS